MNHKQYYVRSHFLDENFVWLYTNYYKIMSSIINMALSVFIRFGYLQTIENYLNIFNCNLYGIHIKSKSLKLTVQNRIV